MLAYYPWPAIALLLVVAALASRERFGVSIVIAIAVTMVARSRLAWLPWWIIQVLGLTVLLVVASRPEPPASAKQRTSPPLPDRPERRKADMDPRRRGRIRADRAGPHLLV
jgi:hypothetical protein